MTGGVALRALRLLPMLVLLAACAWLPATGGTPEAQLRRMNWLPGRWQRTDLPAGESGHETWRRSGAHGLAGAGLARRGDVVVFEETLRIQVRGGAVVYLADVARNPAPVAFALTALDDDGFVFENPAHDFPQVIAYRRDGERLVVRVSATGPAGARASEFRFRRQR